MRMKSTDGISSRCKSRKASQLLWRLRKYQSKRPTSMYAYWSCPWSPEARLQSLSTQSRRRCKFSKNREREPRAIVRVRLAGGTAQEERLWLSCLVSRKYGIVSLGKAANQSSGVVPYWGSFLPDRLANAAIDSKREI